MDTDGDPLLPPALATVPKDRFGMVYVLFYILGLGSLCPWNFFITASEYFKYKLRNTTLPHGADYLEPDNETELQAMFESYLTIASTIPNLLFNFITALLVKRISLKGRMISSSIINILMFGMTIVLVRVPTDSWQIYFFFITMATVTVVNASSSVMGASLFGLASLFPSGYTQALMTGQAMGGIFASLANIVALAAGDSVLGSGLGFFVAATLMAIVTLVAYLLLYKLNYSKYHIIEIGRTLNVDNCTSHQEEDHVIRPTHTGLSSYIDIIKKIWHAGLSVMLVFFITLSCYPSVSSSIVSVNKGGGDWNEKYFSAFVCFLLFNAGDWGGRSIAGWLQFPTFKQKSCLLLLCALRVVFVPLLMLCNAVPRTSPPVFDHDAYPVAFILLLGLTNGYFGTLAMMFGSKCVTTHQAESTGAIMSVCLTTGLVTGSLFSLVLMKSL